jgi:hypothetical protein
MPGTRPGQDDKSQCAVDLHDWITPSGQPWRAAGEGGERSEAGEGLVPRPKLPSSAVGAAPWLSPQFCRQSNAKTNSTSRPQGSGAQVSLSANRRSS